jgi:multisubunit Na+/H+ antiporter MnhB subunit
MDPILWILLALLGFMLIGSLIAIETRDLLSAVICVGAVGFGTSLVFLLLGAPDLAITQVVVEILVLVVLVRVVITRRDETHTSSRSTLAVGVVLLALGVMAAVVVGSLTGEAAEEDLRLHPFGQPRMTRQVDAAYLAPAGRPDLAPAGTEPGSVGGAFLKHGLTADETSRGSGAANLVMGVLLDHRAYDTLGEATVIFVAVIGAYAVLRKVGRSRHAGNESDR